MIAADNISGIGTTGARFRGTTDRASVCDTHFHVLGPFSRFPLPLDSPYRPNEAPAEAYRKVASVLGISRMVVVQPACYGTDNAVTLSAIQTLGADRTRGIALIDDTATDVELRRLHDGGIRAIRINAISDRSVDAKLIKARAAAVAEFGWHIQLHALPAQIVEYEAALKSLPVDVVIDHCGRIDPRAGQNQLPVAAILRLLDTGRVWIKLISYRSLHPDSGKDAMQPFVERFARAAPDKCLWGTDWPHVLTDAPPNTLELLAELYRLIDDEALARRISNSNGCHLYRFDVSKQQIRE